MRGMDHGVVKISPAEAPLRTEIDPESHYTYIVSGGVGVHSTKSMFVMDLKEKAANLKMWQQCSVDLYKITHSKESV